VHLVKIRSSDNPQSHLIDPTYHAKKLKESILGGQANQTNEAKHE
jgi:hypothetical protein